ncbi:MAG: PrsW family intramembrane metalloprotease [Myxococcaceae bacterium]|jgi:RsiW-degrading membrane proteinase PrsW (M82 family)|nr:PrsW family intramembrane metalloprotease [Myxococcaceae bacterium]MCA3016822.1 PrsW family intramembrane metalloprotease [Myxococcaceae bacterium]
MPVWMALTGALPAIALMTIVDLADAKRPEPHWQVRKVALWGGLAVLPCLLAQRWLAQAVVLEGAGGALFEGFVSAALLEEAAKALVLWLVVWRHPAFDERLDGIVYGTRAGLGFALVENVLALWGSTSAVGFVGAYVLRALFAVPCHAIAAGFMGDLAARRRFDGAGPGLAGGIAVAVLVHGAYDAALYLAAVPGVALGVQAVAMLVPLSVVVGGFLLLRHRALLALTRDDADHRHAGRRPQRSEAGYVLR